MAFPRYVPGLAGYFFSCTVFALSIQTSTDSQQVQVGQTIHLRIQADQNLAEDAVDVRPLFRDFIIGNIQISHPDAGQTLWDIPLQPASSGNFQIPALPVADGKTTPVQLTVSAKDSAAPFPAPGNNDTSTVSTAPVAAEHDTLNLTEDGTLVPETQPPRFIEGSVSTEQAYTQQLLIYSLKVADDDHADPQLLHVKSSDDYQVIPFQSPLEDKEIFRDKYQTTKLYRYFIVPLKAGTILLPSQIALDATAATEPELMVHVSAAPAESTDHWLPSAGLTLEQRWEPPTSFTKAHTPITRVITITGINNTLDQLPSIPLPSLPGVKTYTDHEEQSQTEQNGMLISQRIARQVYVPTSDADLTIPEMHVAWWNTISDRAQIATLPERLFKGTIITPAHQATPASKLQHNQTSWPWQLMIMIGGLILGGSLLALDLILSLGYNRWKHYYLARTAWKQFAEACQHKRLLQAHQTLLAYCTVYYQRPFTSLQQLPFYAKAQVELEQFQQYCFSETDHQHIWNAEQFLRKIRMSR